MIDQGKYNQALQQISAFDKQDINRALLYSSAYRELGDKGKSIKYANVAIDLAEKSNLSQKKVLTRLNFALATILGGPFDGIPEILAQARDEFETIKFIDPKEELYYKAMTLTTSGSVSFFIGDKNEGLVQLEKGIELWKELGIKSELARAYHYLGRLLPPESAKLILEEALEIWKTLGNEYRYATTKCFLGSKFIIIGDFNKAINYNQIALDISERLGFKYGEANAIECLATISIGRGEPKEAITKYNRAIVIWQEFKSPYFESVSQLGLGRSYYLMGETQMSLNQLDQCLLIRKAMSLSSDWLVKPLFLSIRAAMVLGLQEKILILNAELQIIHENEPTPNTIAFSLLSNALIKKNSPRLRDKMESQKLLEELEINDPNVDWIIKIITLKNLCELLLLEVEFEDNPQLFIEVKSLIDKIMDIANDQHLYSVKIEAYIFQAKLEMIFGNLEKARKLLDKADIMSTENELVIMSNLVKREKDQLEKDFSKWIELANSNAPIRERIEQANLKNYINKALELQDLWSS